jgi:hypothetical protein
MPNSDPPAGASHYHCPTLNTPADPVPTARVVEMEFWVRAMDPNDESGGSQPHLFKGADGKEYMVKASNCPQGLSCVVNEFVGGLLLDWLGVRHPETILATLPKDLLDATDRAKFADGTKLAPGPAFGSAYWKSSKQGTLANGVFDHFSRSLNLASPVANV